jgi:signal peptidase I
MHRGLIVLTVLLAGCGAGKSATTGLSTTTPPSISSSDFRVPSASMEPTLEVGARLPLSKGRPRVGAIAVYHPPKGAELQECGHSSHAIAGGGAACDSMGPTYATSVEFVKRIVAGPGDRIYMREGHVYREAPGQSLFVREQDSYTKACGAGEGCNFPTPIRIPAGSWYLLGDNRGESDDSRFYGPIPTSSIVGFVTKSS